MARKPTLQELQHISYMNGLHAIADQSRKELARLMPHHGERGRIAEDIVRGVFNKIMPKRFSIGTGVVFSAHGEVSRQTDIVIYDNFYNSPLLSEFGASIFPAEIVYATIEVKSVLTKLELRRSIDAIMQMRKVGSKKHYLVPETILEDGTLKRILAKRQEKTPPRNYIFAFAQRGLGPSYQHFCDNLRKCLDEDASHVHGVCVLDKNWFVGRVAYEVPAKLYGREGNSLLSLYASILKGQTNFAVHMMDFDAYLPSDWV
jgi:hypothetical protein